ncbi:lipid A biosynthesis acyltransferase [Acidovorax sp. SRB_14]|uniref:lysophospholipid acyltransferase family protein n=1 Tax=Acidovorax sp. SRB_14 TaxID=1962699 RepID=UPI00156684C9|nr:lysophospholipid acyltransferase family protein [Acidovorax sp. SRB_14]NMM82151.1 lipid A biosynthesis acyltransferase [Acidovorax sp. SRB_14]
MPFLFRLFSALPLWLLHPVGAALGWLVLALSPTYRRRFVANAAVAGYGFAQVRGAVGHAGRMVAELPRLWMGAPMPCAIVGAEVVEQAWERGRGIVFLTPHLGCFEMSAQAVAQRWGRQRGPITVLYRPARQPWLAKVMETARTRPGMDSVPTTLSGVRQMIKALRRGESVGLLPDQVPPEGLGLWSPVFGRPAYTMTLAARLAQQTGATVLLVRCERLPRGAGYTLFVEALPEPLSASLDEAVAQINRAMEHLIRQSPQQYLWGYARYKQPRADTPAGKGAAPRAEGAA